MNLFTNIDSYTTYRLPYLEVIKRLESDPDFSKIEGDNNRYKVSSFIHLKYPLPVSNIINVEKKGDKGVVINIYSNLIKPLIIILFAFILASLVLISVYDLNSIIPTLVFLPLIIFLLYNMTNQIKTEMKIKLSSLINKLNK